MLWNLSSINRPQITTAIPNNNIQSVGGTILKPQIEKSFAYWVIFVIPSLLNFQLIEIMHNSLYKLLLKKYQIQIQKITPKIKFIYSDSFLKVFTKVQSSKIEIRQLFSMIQLLHMTFLNLCSFVKFTYPIMLSPTLTYILFITCCLGVTINEKADSTHGLQFTNVTSFYSPEFMVSFANLINSGSVFFKNDTRKKLEYIADGLNQNYPVANRRYSVFQENQKVKDQFEAGWFVWNFKTIASYDEGIDRLYPSLSYMLNLEYTWNRTFINKTGQKGTGLQQFELDIITDQIVTYENQNPNFCACHVGQILRKTLFQNWNHFCSNIQNRYAVSAYVFDEKFIYFKPARCYHLLYLKYPGLEFV